MELGAAAFELLGHAVERRRQLADLAGAALVEPHGEVALRESSSGRGHSAYGLCR
jgi:hypothetical protein